MTPPPSHYHSFLLRIWRDDQQTPWRLQLENPHTGERRGFPTIEKLMEYLDQAMGETETEGEGLKYQV